MANHADQRLQGELRLAVLISGGGSTLQGLLSDISKGLLPARVPVVISSKKNVCGNSIAQEAGVPLHIIERRAFSSTEAFSAAVYDVLDAYEPDLVVMAGFLRQITVPTRYEGRIMNVHPSLLPSFGGRGMYGRRVHAAVLESGVKVTGCTVHFVDENYDAGPIILQACVPVHENDTPESLAVRVFAQERRIYPEAIRLYAQGRLQIEGRHVRVLPERL